MYSNVIIKISGEALQKNAESDLYNDKFIKRIVSEVIELKTKGVYISLVVGGGNIWRGRNSQDDIDRAKSDQIGMLATVMNAIYISEHFRLAGTETSIMTPFTVGAFTELFNKDRAVRYLEKGKVVIFAGGSGLPFFSTDTITAIRGAEIGAEAILFAKNGVKGVYNCDPNTNKDAVKFDEMTYEEFIKQNLQAIDISAMSICMERDLKSIVFDIDENNSIIDAVIGVENSLYKIGTLISNNDEE